MAELTVFDSASVVAYFNFHHRVGIFELDLARNLVAWRKPKTMCIKSN